MSLWVFMLLMDLIIPGIVLLFGVIFRSYTPGTINSLFGYRTRRSMKNMDTWDFAHKFVGKLWLVSGIVMIIITLIALLFVVGGDDETISKVGGTVMILQLIPLMGSIIPTEIALRRTFDKDGNRK